MCYLKFYHVCIISLILTVADDIIALDPALFLGPSPPLLPTSHTVSPQERWYSVSNRDKARLIERQASLQSDDELLANAETFWPSLRTAYYGVRAVPLAFSVSGNYGKYSDNAPVVATSYISVQPTSGTYRNSGLAGSSYETYGNDQSGIRIFNGAGKTGWSGWGNGKWGNYGKG